MRALKLIYFLISVCFFVICNTNVYSQLQINTAMTPQQLVQNVLVGGGVQISNITFNSTAAALNIGEFNNGNLTNIGLSHGIILSSGNVNNAIGPNNSTSMGNPTNSGSDPQLQTLIPNHTINDAAVLQFDFIPLSDTIKFRYVFGSEEYPEFVNSNFNDVFGFFVTGANPNGAPYVNKNIALIPNSALPVTIDNVNQNVNTQYYVSNTGGVSIQYDGFTVVLTAYIVVQPCTQYHIKIAVADAGDTAYDSAVFLEANSFTSNAVTVTTDFSTPNALPMAIEGCNDAKVKFTLPYSKADTFYVLIDTIYGTATNGVDYPFIGDSIAIPPGQISKTITISPFMDNIVEPLEYVIIKIKSTVCTMDSIKIPILSYKPISITTGNDTMICQDLNHSSSAQLQVNPTNGLAPYHILWQPPADLNNSTILNPVAKPDIGNHTNFLVEVTDSTGCPGDTASVLVTVNEAPSMSVDLLPFPAKGCTPLEVVFTDGCTPQIQTYNWQFGDGSSSTDQSPTHIYTQVGSFTVKLNVETPEGCKGEMSLFDVVKVYPIPVASFTVSPQIAPISNALITFNSSASSPFVSSWVWDFGDPSSTINTSNTQNSFHGYSANGLYTVTLIVASDFNCMDTVTMDVRIIEDSLVFPNIITPNGDSHNDYFDIPNLENYVTNRLMIFNRWGKMVYNKEPYIPDTDKWDGEGLSDGTYYYILKYRGYLKEGEQKGSVTILR